jgi:hypothetical protein
VARRPFAVSDNVLPFIHSGLDTTARIELYAPQKTLRTANRTATLSLATPPPRKRDNPYRYYLFTVTAAGNMLAVACVRV